MLTQTAKVHNAAWEETFNTYLQEQSAATVEPFRPFDPGVDYSRYVDGRPRADGVRSFLASRGVELAEGSADDPPEADTINGVGNRKNEILLRRISNDGVQVYDGSLAYLHAARCVGLRRAVVSASANCRDVLIAAGIEELVEVRVDGVVAREMGLRGKPEPDTFLAAAQQLGVEPENAAVFEDALAGVSAARAGGFGCVVGVDRVGIGAELRANGADVVVGDLGELLVGAVR